MMSTTAPQLATTPIPVQLSETEFTAFLLPHLSMPKRGPKCTLGYDRVFNLILWVLYTGMPWKCWFCRKFAFLRPNVKIGSLNLSPFVEDQSDQNT
jgi:hypothetical protein